MKVEQVMGVLVPSSHEIRIQHRMGKIGILVDGSVAEVLNTVETHKIGFDMIRKADACRPDDFIRIKINRRPIDVLPTQARQIGAGMLRKADQADDFQINQKVSA